MFRSLSVRLSLTYAACCLVSMTAVLIICYLFLDGSLRRITDAEMASEIPEYRSLLEARDLTVLQDALRQEVLSKGIDQVFFRILDASGNVLAGTDTSAWRGLPADNAALHSALTGKVVFSEFRDASRDFSARVVYGQIGDNMVLQLGESQEGNLALLRRFRRVFTMATLAFVLCSLVAGAYMARRALAGVQRIATAAVQITAGAWDHRVPVSHHQDEIDDLASAFNTMVDRIQVLFRELRDVTDDIAHDLRTPLMRIRGEAEMALRDSGSDPVNQERYGSVLEECDQMLHLINTMLEISQTEAGAKPLERRPVDLGAIAEDVCDLFRPAAEDKEINLTCSVDGQLPPIYGEPQRLKRAFAHLVDNAIKYTSPGGEVAVHCTVDGGAVAADVRDTGIGIAPGAREDVFGRFYRVEASRTEPGNGLGLSLARAIIRAHGGDIVLESAEGKGSTFTVRLPASAVGERR